MVSYFYHISDFNDVDSFNVDTNVPSVNASDDFYTVIGFYYVAIFTIYSM